jgi:glycosyltransferase involved in cell wall biosynthesis
MNLMIFTPGSSASAVGGISRLVAHALLAQGHEVVVVRTEDASFLETPAQDFNVPTLNWNDAQRVESAIGKADMLIYQIGDDYRLHRGCLEWLPAHPGLVCLHGFHLGRLFRGWARQRQPEAMAILEAWYGRKVAARYFESGADFDAQLCSAVPLTEWVSAMALGVVAHSKPALERSLKACAGPVALLGLPRAAPVIAPLAADEQGAPGEIGIVTIGEITPGKRARSVIRAISRSPLLRGRASYRIVGTVDPASEQELLMLADRLRVKLDIRGEAEEVEQARAIEAADIVCCLGPPEQDMGSARLIESMLLGKAAVVMAHESFAELPDACVRKIAPGRELAELKSALELLCRDEETRAALGNEAANWAKGYATGADEYVEALLEACRSCAKAAPTLKMCRFYSDILAGWSGLQDEAALARVLNPLAIFSTAADA